MTDRRAPLSSAAPVDGSVAAPGWSSTQDLRTLDPSAVVTSLARALAAIHDGRVAIGSDLVLLEPAEVVVQAQDAVDRGWTPPRGSPYERVAPAHLLQGLRARVEAMVLDESPGQTIGLATISNLDPATVAVATSTDPDRDGEVLEELSGAPNVTFRVRRVRSGAPADRSQFVDRSGAALADRHRDLAVAAADVVATFGAGAVIGFVEAYAGARRDPESVDLVRLDWWSMAAAILGPGAA